MQIFKAFFKTVKQQLTSLIIYFFIFIALIILLTNNGKLQMETTYKETKIDIAVIDRDNSVLSKSLYDYIDENHNIIDIKDNKETMADELFYRNVEYILIIDKGFEDNIKIGNRENIIESIKVPQSVSGHFVDNQINQYLTTLSAYVSSGSSMDEAVTFTHNTCALSTDVSLHIPEGTSTAKSSTYYFFIYIPYIIICMLTVGLGAILITFRKYDLNARIQCSALSIAERNVSLTISSLVFSLSCWALFIVLAIILYSNEIFSIKGMLYIANSLIFLLVAMSMTYLISFFAKNSSALNMASNVIGLGVSFLGGIFVPLQFMSSGVVAFAKFLPTYWYVTASEVIDTYTGTSEQLNKILSYFGIEFIFALALFAAALAASKLKKH